MEDSKFIDQLEFLAQGVTLCAARVSSYFSDYGTKEERLAAMAFMMGVANGTEAFCKSLFTDQLLYEEKTYLKFIDTLEAEVFPWLEKAARNYDERHVDDKA